MAELGMGIIHNDSFFMGISIEIFGPSFTELKCLR